MKEKGKMITIGLTLGVVALGVYLALKTFKRPILAIKDVDWNNKKVTYELKNFLPLSKKTIDVSPILEEGGEIKTKEGGFGIWAYKGSGDVVILGVKSKKDKKGNLTSRNYLYFDKKEIKQENEN